MAKKVVCEHCGASKMQYKHSLNNALLEGLLRLYRHGKPVNLKELDLNRNQWDNFQKLRYWDLVEHAKEGGVEKAGVWKITIAGMDFIEGRVGRQRSVWTYRGERVEFAGEIAFARDIHEGYKKIEDYRREAKALLEGAAASQTQMF